MDLKNITLGILSWKSYKTLNNTLESFKNLGLLELVEVIIYFQEISDLDIEIANKYNIKYFGTDKNTGIIGGFMELINNTTTKYFIFCENDFELVHSKEETALILQDCMNLLDNHNVHKINLRDRKNPGIPLYSRPRVSDPSKYRFRMNYPWKIESLFFVENPEKAFINVFNRIKLNFLWYVCDYKHQNWSNNIFISHTDWLRQKIFPLLLNCINQSKTSNKKIFLMENYLIEYAKDYKLAGGIGLFTHNRLDR